MNRKQYLLIKLQEELLEAAHRVSKALCFGLEEVQEGQPLTNRERISDELDDAALIIALLRVQEDVHLLDFASSLRENKMKKVEKYYQQSVDLGIVSD